MPSSARRSSRASSRAIRTGATLAGISFLAALVAVPAGPAAAAADVDVTDNAGTVSDRWSTTDGRETVEEAFDNLSYSKYFTVNPDTWLRFSAAAPAVVTSYSITSANDFPARDPRDWTLKGSVDGTTWVPLDTRAGEEFGSRYQNRSFAFTNSTAYRYYELDVTANNGDAFTQLAEWRLFGPGTVAAPTAPADLTANAVSGDQVILTWRNTSRSQASFRLERSTDGVNWTPRTLPAGTTRLYRDTLLNGTTAYRYRLRAQNTAGTSAWTGTVGATTLSQNLPATWQEHAPGHDALLTRRYQDSDVAIYTDSTLGTDQRWVDAYVGRVWRYAKQTYGDMGSPRLSAILHGGPYGSATPHDITEADWDHRTVIDVPNNDWSESNNYSKDATAHEIAHLVEGYHNGIKGSPAFALWGDSQWADIFQYDVYLKTGMWADSQRWKAEKLANSATYPQADTYWFRDWWLPIYEQHGQTAALKKYFDLVQTQFPALNQEHPRDMTWGEFVHFWSGAAGVDLSSRAQTAFGWSDERQAELEQARRDFPGVTYRTA